MLIILSLLVISSFTSQQAYGYIDPIEALKFTKKAWDMFATIQQKPTLMIRYQQGRSKRTKLFKWSKFEKMDPKQRVHGPFAYVFSIADGLVRDTDVNRCDLVYYDEGEALTVDDDDSLLEAVEAGPDIGNNKRLIDVICETEGSGTPGGYREAKKAYDYAVMANSESNAAERKVAAKELENVGLGGYNVDAEGIQTLDVNGEDFLTRALDIADAYKWDEKTIAAIKTVPSAGKIFRSRSYVEFDAATWTFSGSFAKFAAWKSDKENEKFSMFVATSKFEFTIPKSAREGNFADRHNIFGADGGTVEQRYIKAYEKVLEGEAIDSSKKDLDEPKPEDWALEGNRTEL